MPVTAIWRLSAVLPGLQLGESIEAGPFAAISPKDPRYAQIVRDKKCGPKFLSRFRSPFGSKFQPAVIINRRGAQQIKALQVTDFRNLVAACCQLRGFAYRYQPGPSLTGPVFSDFFDIFPAWPQDKGTGLSKDSVTTRGAMESGIYALKGFTGGLPYGIFNPTYQTAWPDAYLLSALTKLFTDRTAAKAPIRRRVFRALEVMRLASRSPIGNLGSQQDFGLSFAQWVSAMEILTHPLVTPSGPRTQVNCSEVVKVIGSIPWDEAKLRRKGVRWTWMKKGVQQTKRLRKAEQIYHRMYKVRCDYLHGNALTDRGIEELWRPSRGYLIGQAPVLFRWYLLHTLAHFGYSDYFKPIPISEGLRSMQRADDVRLFEWPLFGNPP